ncbi:MAG: hypothetical protein WCF22_19285, partial [Candidatus Sulfotelmatobacter sp.]
MKNLSLAILFFAGTFSFGQTSASSALPSSAPALPSVAAPTVTRTTQAVHYRLQGGTTKVDFHGTDLLQGATGEAKVEGKKTNFQIEV